MHMYSLGNNIIKRILNNLEQNGVTEQNVLLWKGYLYGLYDVTLIKFYLDLFNLFPDIGFRERVEIEFYDIIAPDTERELIEKSKGNNHNFNCQNFFSRIKDMQAVCEQTAFENYPIAKNINISDLKNLLSSQLAWRGPTDSLILFWKGYLTAFIHTGVIMYDDYLELVKHFPGLGNDLLTDLYRNAPVTNLNIPDITVLIKEMPISPKSINIDCCHPQWSPTEFDSCIKWSPVISIDKNRDRLENRIKKLISEYLTIERPHFLAKTLILRGYLIGFLESDLIDEQCYLNLSRCLYSIGYSELIRLMTDVLDDFEYYKKLDDLTLSINRIEQLGCIHPEDYKINRNQLDLEIILHKKEKDYRPEIFKERAYNHLESGFNLAHLIWGGYLICLYQHHLIDYDLYAFINARRVNNIANEELCELYVGHRLIKNENEYITQFVLNNPSFI
ncbi:MAG: hypothetical protein IPP74_05240 [Alphaproteobacteria bacterium]|nr:hypothetical protein [Alphaproteobacteria bacterium]